VDELQQVKYPARLILSRYNPNFKPAALVIVDPTIIENEDDLASVRYYYLALERIPGTIRYRQTLAGVDEVDRVVAELYAAMNVQPPAPAPGPVPDPDPVPTALELAYQAAREAFAGSPGTLHRLDEALAIVKADGVRPLGDGQWRVTTTADSYQVNGSCGCADYGLSTMWCRHRLAVALFVKAARLESNAAAIDEAGSAANTPAREAPAKRTNPQRQYTTTRRATQATR